MQGIPHALKDIYGTAGIRTTCHSKLLLDNVPKEDCLRRFVIQFRLITGEAGGRGELVAGLFPSARVDRRGRRL